MGQTIVQKVMAKNSGKQNVEPGDVVSCKVDKVLIKDYTHGYYAYLAFKEIGVDCKIAPNDIILADLGAFVPEVTLDLHNWVKEMGVPAENIY